MRILSTFEQNRFPKGTASGTVMPIISGFWLKSGWLQDLLISLENHRASSLIAAVVKSLNLFELLLVASWCSVSTDYWTEKMFENIHSLEIGVVKVSIILSVVGVILTSFVWKRRHLYMLSWKCEGPFYKPFIGNVFDFGFSPQSE